MLGEDEYGCPITSCIILKDNPGVFSFGPERKGKWRSMIIDTIQKLSETQSKVLKKELIELVINHDTQSLTEGKRDQRKSSISRSLNGLIDGGYYKTEEEFILCALQELSPAPW